MADQAGALASLALLRAWRLDAARIELQKARHAADTASCSARVAGEGLASALAWSSAHAIQPDPVLHRRTLDHLARLAAEARRSDQELTRRAALADQCRLALQARHRELDMVRRAQERNAADHLANRTRQAWNVADAAWIVARRTQERS
ncbi:MULTISPECIES: hypothetical protein [Ramlibacter]|nr:MULTISPECIES: hypothetical protein [Ramlibacter]MBA2964780.1 hypothetical protein [Ramlibacter sp. CGMCC 1.13660]